jgi:hypothetical protein
MSELNIIREQPQSIRMSRQEIRTPKILADKSELASDRSAFEPADRQFRFGMGDNYFRFGMGDTYFRFG